MEKHWIAFDSKKIQISLWLALGLAFSAAYSLLAVWQAFQGEFVIQDDARQHIFWMQRFLDPTLFPNDPIADYFQSVAPVGYAKLYEFAAWIGIHPFIFNKFLPVVLGLLTTGYCFGTCWQLLPVPIAGFAASLLLSQCLWLQDGLVSGTVKAFVYPLFLAFLFHWLKRDFWISLGTILLLGIFYPQYIFLCAGILFFHVLWERKNPRDRTFCILGILVSILVLLPYAVRSSAYGPTVTVEQARALPEFLSKGRAAFFQEDPWKFWLTGRGGLRLSLEPPLLCLGLLLPVFFCFPKKFPLAGRAKKLIVLPQLLLSSLGVFFIAHLFLFQLHLPSRYTQHSFRIFIAISAGIAIAILLDGLYRLCRRRKAIALFRIMAIALGAMLLFYPLALDRFPWTGYVVGETPELYQFFQAQPKDILIASTANEANNLPSFARRSILVGSEYAIPYHTGYYNRFRQRAIDLLEAQYSSNAKVVKDFLQKYGIDFWMMERNAFIPEYVSKNAWLRQYQPAAERAVRSLQSQDVPFVETRMDRCMAFETERLVVLEVECLLEN